MTALAFFDALAALAEEARAAFFAGFLVFARIGAIIALLPAFGEQVVPRRIRLMLALALTAVVAPAALPLIDVRPQTMGEVAFYIGSEAAVGLALGAGMRLLVMVLQIAGTMAAQSTSLAQFFGGAGVDPQPAISQVLVMAGLALLVMAGLPERAAQFLILSYQLLPAGQWPDAAVLAEWGVGRVAHAFALAFVLAAPFVIGSAIYNLALGAINRAMPQLMVAFIGAPALTWGGLVLLMLAAPVMITVWFGAFQTYLNDPWTVPRP
jgi:flagellar biosynthesis protein FliR